MAIATTTNGKQPVSPRPAAPPALVESPPVTEAQGDLRPVLNALRAEVQVLSRKIDQFQPAQADSDRVIAAVEALPDKVASVATRALQVEHDKNQRELRDLWNRTEKAQRNLAEGALEPVTLPMLEARFEWLVNEISDRMVTLGNEISRLDKR